LKIGILQRQDDMMINLRDGIRAFLETDFSLAESIRERKSVVKSQFQSFCDSHIEGLYEKDTVSIQTTTTYLDLLDEIQRINGFVFRIAAHLLQMRHVV